jgi:hypothetical protein
VLFDAAAKEPEERMDALDYMDELLRAGTDENGGGDERTEGKPSLLARLRGDAQGFFDGSETLELGFGASRKIA